MIHFVSMIDWVLELLMGIKFPNSFHISCLKNASRQHIVTSMDIPLLHDESHLDLSPKANLYTWEEKLGDMLMREHIFGGAYHMRMLQEEERRLISSILAGA